MYGFVWRVCLGLALWLAVALLVLFFSSLAYAHDWYDKDCCDTRDCVPVTKVESKPGGLTLFHTKKFGIVKLQQERWSELAKANRLRPSKDSGFHICVVTFYGDFMGSEGAQPEQYVRCVYGPGGG